MGQLLQGRASGLAPLSLCSRRRVKALSGAAALFLLASTGACAGTNTASRVLTVTDWTLLARAEESLIKDCMAAHGFSYYGLPYAADPGLVPPVPYLLTVDQAKTTKNIGDDPAKLVSYLNSLTPAERTAFQTALGGPEHYGPQLIVDLPQGGQEGHSISGCQASSERTLFGSFRTWYTSVALLQNYGAVVQSAVMSAPNYRRALQQWRQCVERFGFNWQSPSAAVPAAIGPAATHESTIETSCLALSGLIDIARRDGAYYRKRLPDEYRKEVTLYHSLAAAALSRAGRIVSSEPK